MQAVVNAVKELIEMVGTIFDFIIGFIQDLVYIVKLLGQFVLNIPQYFGWLPTAALSLISVAFTIVVIYMVSNRK